MKLPIIFAATILCPVPFVFAAPATKPAPLATKVRPVIQGGELMGFDNSGQSIPCPLKDTKVQANISGFVARVNVEQTFHNPSKSAIEALYTFPLPSDSAVDEMTLIIGNRKIVGKIKQKEEARRIYNAAKAAGKAAALLDQERPNIFTQSVANILPGQEVKVLISYTNTLKYTDGTYEWAFPTVVGPRYVGPSVGQPQGTKDADKITPPIAAAGTRSGHDISLRVNLNAGVKLGAVSSISHAINVTRQGDNVARIELENGATIPNKDFILRFKAGGEKVETGLLTQTNEKGSFFTFLFQPPLNPRPSQVAPKEMLYVIDQTGSQSGFPVEKSKEAIRAGLKKLSYRDTFNVIGFNTDVYPCFPKPVRPTEENVKKALAFLNPIQGNGGTDILKSMQYLLKQPDDLGRLRIIAYFTDGYVGNDMATIDYVRKNRGRARIFPFGIGNSVNRFFIDSIAREGKGFAQIVTLAEAADKAADNFIDKVSRPILLKPQISFGSLPVSEVFPATLSDLYANAPLVIHGRYKGAANGKITVSGIYEGKAWREEVPVTFPAKATDNPALPSLWARAKIEDIQAADWLGAQNGSPDPKVKEKIVQTALDFKLLSQYTSFVAVEEKISNPGGQQNSIQTPVEMPEGVTMGEPVRQLQAKAAANYSANLRTRFAARPGDPLIRVEAPRGAKQVIAILPDGSIKKLRFNTLTNYFEARFDIPNYASDGNYKIQIVIVNKTGSRQLFSINYRVDTKAPDGKTNILTENGKWHLSLQTGDEIDRVSAFLPWNERIELSRDENGIFGVESQVPEPWLAREANVRFVLTDKAHNRSEIWVSP